MAHRIGKAGLLVVSLLLAASGVPAHDASPSIAAGTGEAKHLSTRTDPVTSPNAASLLSEGRLAAVFPDDDYGPRDKTPITETVQTPNYQLTPVEYPGHVTDWDRGPSGNCMDELVAHIDKQAFAVTVAETVYTFREGSRISDTGGATIRVASYSMPAEWVSQLADIDQRSALCMSAQASNRRQTRPVVNGVVGWAHSGSGSGRTSSAVTIPLDNVILVAICSGAEIDPCVQRTQPILAGVQATLQHR